MKFISFWAVSAPLAWFGHLAAADLVGIPTVPFKEGHGKGYHVAGLKSIVVDTKHASARDETGQTLIPPSLIEFANTFAEDLLSTHGLHVPVVKGHGQAKNSIFMTIGDPDEYRNAAGQLSSEGYTLSVDQDGIVITGASPLGAWWGTRTLLQQVVLNNGIMPAGSGTDTPGWETRGMMLDCGRHFYPKEFLTEMCSYMSFFKQSVFHLHLSDNLYANPNYTFDETMNLYARFRLWSESPSVAGLVKYTNESYSRADFEEIQTTCAARGVTIIPEIEAPGHALPIVQWRPQLGYNGDLSLLNISHPETIPTMQTIWAEFLPWFHSKVVSIGADEYNGPADDYNTFVNAMDVFISDVGKKSTRIWGTFPPKAAYGDNNIHKNVSIQHWEFFEDNPYYDYIQNDYSVVNSNDDFYVVIKETPGGYLNHINISKTFVGNPDGHTLWRPYLFDQSNITDNPPENSPYVLGAIEAMWNDWGYNTSVYSEAYYAWRDGIPALADKHWGGNLTSPQFDEVFPKLHPYIPAQNLERAVSSKGDLIFDYKITGKGSTRIKDSSPNGYDAKTSCKRKGDALSITPDCSVTTPLSSKGRNYTLNLSLKVDKLDDPTNTTIISGSDSVLMLTPNITLFAAGNYYRLNSTIPLHEWVDLSIIGKGNQTFASVTSMKSKKELSKEEFLTQMGINGQSFYWNIMAIEAPIKEVTGWTGELSALSLSSVAK